MRSWTQCALGLVHIKNSYVIKNSYGLSAWHLESPSATLTHPVSRPSELLGSVLLALPGMETRLMGREIQSPSPDAPPPPMPTSRLGA